MQQLGSNGIKGMILKFGVAVVLIGVLTAGISLSLVVFRGNDSQSNIWAGAELEKCLVQLDYIKKHAASDGTATILKSMSMSELQKKVAEAEAREEKLMTQIRTLEAQLNIGAEQSGNFHLTQEISEKAREVIDKIGSSNLDVISSVAHQAEKWKGYECSATEAELMEYLDYKPRSLCPDDWYFTQQLIFVKNCFSLPRRRCFARTPPDPVEPLPFPKSLFSQDALDDRSVRWSLHQCKSFHCLNTREAGDCRNCFNLSLEATRWKSHYHGSPTIKEVIDLKAGGLRLGLDAGGGTGSFAAHMAQHNVTVMTTAMNIETVYGQTWGLPYMETIALRGLIPLHVPHKSRLPLFDGTLDIIHSVNSIKYLPALEFEELVFEWDRVLRVGGLLWFEMFYATVEEMPIYVSIIELLQYRRLYWNLKPKDGQSEVHGEHLYLNCILEKPVRKPGRKNRKPVKEAAAAGGGEERR